MTYGLDDQNSSHSRTGDFSLHHCVQTGYGAHPDSYPMGTGALPLGGKAARA